MPRSAPRSTAYSLIVPAVYPTLESALADVMRSLLPGLLACASGCSGGGVELVAVDDRAQRAWRLNDGRPLAVRPFDRRPRILMNAAFLLCDRPPVRGLEEAAARTGSAWCGSRATGDLFAVAFAPRPYRSTSEVWAALRSLAAGTGEDAADSWRALVGPGALLPPPMGPESSPGMRDVARLTSRPLPEAPRYLNTALRELICSPCDRGPTGTDPARVAEALLAQRDASRVPWIFNSLLNEIELRLGTTEPASVPPEVHLSLTGACNLECRFCGYTHDTARFERVAPDQVARLDFLRYARVLRLNSGLGEPTANHHLAAIVEESSARFPHLLMNFFTNGVNLRSPRLLASLLGRVRWLSVSLNAATRESWREVCQSDFFDQVLANLRALHDAKRRSGHVLPLTFASMVLQGANIEDLPRMPALCRAQGIDRFAAFPYFGLGYPTPLKYGPESTLEACRGRYEAIYEKTLLEAQAHEVSIELPLTASQKNTAFGLERRGFHDFARIETNDWPLERFLGGLRFEAPDRAHCHFLWRQAAAGSTHRDGQSESETHYLYPCLGPLSSVDLSRRTAFRFPDARGFQELWRNPVFTLLRAAQRKQGLSPVCDACRQADTRDPRHFARLGQLVGVFAAEHSGR